MGPLGCLLWLLVDCQVHLEAFGVVLGEINELTLHKDVVNGTIAKDQAVLGAVSVFEGCLEDLVNRGDPSATCNVADLLLLHNFFLC